MHIFYRKCCGRHCVFDCLHLEDLLQQHAKLFEDCHDAMRCCTWHKHQKSVGACVPSIVTNRSRQNHIFVLRSLCCLYGPSDRPANPGMQQTCHREFICRWRRRNFRGRKDGLGNVHAWGLPVGEEDGIHYLLLRRRSQQMPVMQALSSKLSSLRVYCSLTFRLQGPAGRPKV